MTIQVKASDSWHWKQILCARDILAPGICNGEWLAAPARHYTVASGYDWMLGENGEFRFAPSVWHPNVLPKYSFILWLVIQRKVLTLDRLAQWFEHSVDTTCVLCGEDQETLPHLLFACPFSRSLMLVVAEWVGLHACPVRRRHWRSWIGHCGHGRSVRIGTWCAAMVAKVYTVWMERNRRMHDQAACTVESLI